MLKPFLITIRFWTRKTRIVVLLSIREEVDMCLYPEKRIERDVGGGRERGNNHNEKLYPTNL